MRTWKHGPCPLHNRETVDACTWCASGDHAQTLDLIRAQVHAHVCGVEPATGVLGVLVRRRIGDAILAEALVRVPGHCLAARRFLVKPDALLPLD